MVNREEKVTITIVRPEVGIQYDPVTQEAEIGDRSAAVELGLHALTLHAIELRRERGFPIPFVLTQLVQAETWRDL
jgi:hypothetical protein